MYAVIETGGKQIAVKEGDIIQIEKIPAEPGQSVNFDKVLFINDGKKCKIGRPDLEDSRVVGELIKQDRDKKVVTFKFKRRKKYRKKIGHRQDISIVKITEIQTETK